MFLRSKRLNEDFELADGTTTIGRQPDCRIVLAGNSVSKRHLEIRVTDEKVEVRDKNSRNNTRINSRQIRGLGWIELRTWDIIDVSGYDFCLMHKETPFPNLGSCIVDEGESSFGGPGSKSISLSTSMLGDSQQFSQLRALLAITSTLREVLQTEDVLERAVAILFEIFPAVDHAAICLLSDDQVIEPKWWQVRDVEPGSTIRISQNIGRHVAKTSEAVITSDAMVDFGDAKSVHAGAMRSVMCCPLLDADGKAFGIIHVDSRKSNMFTELDLEVLAAAAMQLSLAINCARLHAVAVEDELLRHDVEQAREVQQRYLPDSPPQIEGYDLAGFYRAARHVGGDYFDYVSLPGGRLAIVLGDVVGKGVPAALTMVRLATETRTGLEVCESPKALITRLNHRFIGDFITLVVLVVDPTTHQIVIANAGHEPPLLRSLDGAIASIGFDLSGLPVGVDEDAEYHESTIQFNSGECLLVYSDGFPDAEHRKTDRRFGSDLVAQSLSGCDGTASQIIEGLVGQVDQFVEDSPQFDDMCSVCLRRIT